MFLAAFNASISNSSTSTSSAAFTSGFNSEYITSRIGWYIESNFCNTVFSFGTNNIPFLKTI